MYSKAISREEPGCIIILLDRSQSMHRRWGRHPVSLAQGATDALNRLLLALTVRGTKHDGVRHYFDIGVFGYGERPRAKGDGVESVFGGGLLGRELVALPDLHHNPLERVPDNNDSDDPGRPIWLKPLYGGYTPMCEAIYDAGAIAGDWIRRHPTSYPPIVINITDGRVTDNGYQGADVEEWAKRLRSLSTSDGEVLLLNIFLSPDERAVRTMFPAREDGLDEPGPMLFRMSSELPLEMAKQAEAYDIVVPRGARAMMMNADLDMLVHFLEIGTRRRLHDM